MTGVERSLSASADHAAVNRILDIDTLLDEIARYLAAVEAFRAAACEPTWLPGAHGSSATLSDP